MSQRSALQLIANQAIGNYCNTLFPMSSVYLDLTTFPGIRALPNFGNPNQNYENFTNVAILRYLEAPIVNPSNDSNANIPGSQLPLVETNLHVGTYNILSFMR